MNFRDQFIIYFIKPVGMTGPIKIGLSSDPIRRLAEFGSWSPIPLELIGQVPGTWNDEQFLHGCLATDHLHGEWFTATPVVLSAVASVLSDGNFDGIRKTLTPVGSVLSKKNRATRAFMQSRSETAA